MMRFLTEVAPLWAWLILAVTFIAYALLALWGVHWYYERTSLPRNDAIAGAVFGAVAGANSLLVALIIVTLWSNFLTVQKNLNLEAQAVRDVSRDVDALPAGSDLRRQWARYKAQVRSLEIPSLCEATGEGGAYRPALAGPQFSLLLSQALTATRIESSLRNDLLSHLYSIEQHRDERTVATYPVILWEVWLAAFVLSGMMLFAPAFFEAPYSRLRIVPSVLLAIVLATVFFVAIRLDDVFCGSTSVDISELRAAVAAPK